MSVTASRAAFHTTGPIYHFVRLGGFSAATGNTNNNIPTGNLYYLGTCETQPVIRINRYGRPVFNDIGGRSVPMQETHDGEDADLGLMLSMFSQLAYSFIQTASSTVETSPGVETALSRGALLYGVRTFELWQYNGFYGTSAATPDLPIGFYWPQVKLAAHSLENSGSEDEKILLTLKATPRYIKPSGTGAGGFVLRSQNVADFNAVGPLVPALIAGMN